MNKRDEMLLETSQGRKALAESMAQDIRASLEYQSVARKLLQVDEMPEGALARYERDVASIIPREEWQEDTHLDDFIDEQER